MRLRTAAILLLLTTVGFAQPASDLLQKGIYTQRTVGDYNGAIALYRQVIANSGADRATAVRAQMLIVGAYLAKGDLDTAGREFNTLTSNYGDQKETISAVAPALQSYAMQIRTGALQPPGRPVVRAGNLENGVYHHTATSTAIRVPAGWSVQTDGGSSGGGEFVNLMNGPSEVFVYMKSRPAELEEIPWLLDAEIAYKHHQRKFDGNDESYKIRPGSQTRSGSGGRQSTTVVFDYVEGGKPRIEYGTWILTTKTLVYLRSFGEPSSLAQIVQAHKTLEAAIDIP
jgi:hypothetical protein